MSRFIKQALVAASAGLLTTLAGAVPAQQGKVLVNETVLERSSAMFRNTVGYVPQDSSDVFRDAVYARTAAPDPSDPVAQFQGGAFVRTKVKSLKTGRVLERHNFEVGTAKDGVDAIEKMAERVPDLMLLDIEMPRMDGYELAQTMRGDARLRDVPIIMITSRTGDKHRQRAFEIGVNRYLGKPYQEPELIRHVFELLAEVAARG
jgi:CheY-like chemotaxis protein